MRVFLKFLQSFTLILLGAGLMLTVVIARGGPSNGAAPPPAAPVVAHPHYASWVNSVRGITLSGYQDFIVNDSTVAMIERQERAARDHWKANTIRLQFLQDRLVGGKGNTWNKHYFYYIQKGIRYALSLGLTVVINDQTEVSMGFAKNEPAPDHATKVFWGRMMGYYANQPKVIFDLFNEPRNETWEQWLNGGTLDDWSGTYIGEQQLVSYIRSEGAKNTIWVEGINWASTLAGVPELHDPLKNLVYTFHHPGSPHPDKNFVPGPKIWWDSFGYWAAEGHRVLDGEFANYIGNYYWDNHPGKSVRAYLAYLEAHHIGVLCWSLVAGSLNANADFRSESQEPQGDGKIIHDFYQRQTILEHIQYGRCPEQEGSFACPRKPVSSSLPYSYWSWCSTSGTLSLTKSRVGGCLP